MFVFGIIAIVFGAMKSSDVYKMAYQRAKNDRRVVEALGQPIRDGWIVAGKTEVSGSSGQSDTSFSIRGPRGGATVYAVATKSEGEWQYSKLRVRIDKTSETIDLLEEGAE